jgi:hypothetical protein
MYEEIDRHRRSFLSTAAIGLAASQLDLIGAAAAQSSKTQSANLPAIKPGTNTTFAPLKQINAGS